RTQNEWDVDATRHGQITRAPRRSGRDVERVAGLERRDVSFFCRNQVGLLACRHAQRAEDLNRRKGDGVSDTLVRAQKVTLNESSPRRHSFVHVPWPTDVFDECCALDPRHFEHSFSSQVTRNRVTGDKKIVRTDLYNLVRLLLVAKFRRAL